jgi:hypothetical protein
MQRIILLQQVREENGKPESAILQVRISPQIAFKKQLHALHIPTA